MYLSFLRNSGVGGLRSLVLTENRRPVSVAVPFSVRSNVLIAVAEEGVGSGQIPGRCVITVLLPLLKSRGLAELSLLPRTEDTLGKYR